MVKIFNIIDDGFYIFAKFRTSNTNDEGYIKIEKKSKKRIEYYRPDSIYPLFGYTVYKKIVQMIDLNIYPVEETVAIY